MKAVHRVLDPNRRLDVDDDACALAVMTKAPRAGAVKTRLVPPLTHDEAAQLNSSFLSDVAAAISAAATERIARGVAVYTPVGTEAAYQNILPEVSFSTAQRGPDSGDRLISEA